MEENKMEIKDAFGTQNNIKFVSYDKKNENVVYKMELDEHHLNPIGVVHGAAIFALVDTAAGYLAHVGLNKPSVTLSATTNYIKGSQARLIYSNTRVIQNTNMITVVEVTVHDGYTDDLLVSSVVTMYRLKNFEDKQRDYGSKN